MQDADREERLAGRDAQPGGGSHASTSSRTPSNIASRFSGARLNSHMPPATPASEPAVKERTIAQSISAQKAWVRENSEPNDSTDCSAIALGSGRIHVVAPNRM
jgi:hypothetical protein